MKKQDIAKRKLAEQGLDTSIVFSGDTKFSSTSVLYGETARLFAKIISEKLPNNSTRYHIADFGSFKGELLRNIIIDLNNKGYDLHTYAIDRIDKVLEENSANVKIKSDLTEVPLLDKSVDVAIARYALVWNGLEKQIKILKELSRTPRHFALVQHASADSNDPYEWRKRIDHLFSGKEIPELRREGHYFSSRQELEQLMDQNGISFDRIDELVVPSLSDVFIERYGLDSKKAQKTKEILGNKDYAVRTTWLIYPRESK